ncbi:MAG: tetratricopeptide repeat protein, partial [Verrucomicrobia bacterium]|nr:tetratricopeptide repeat protein [Verrucomicrobiota bacterium]
MTFLKRIGLMCLIGCLTQFAHADISSEIAEASAPIAEGVPEVAVVHLQALLMNNLSESGWRAVVEKLAEAQIAARQPEKTLVLLEDIRARDLPWATFWRAQAFASLNRWAEALPLYEQLANSEGSSFRSAAIFGAAEMLRALGRRDEALNKFTLLVHDPEWSTRAHLRAAELCIETGDVKNARRLLEELRPTSIADRRERRVLRGRLELIQRRPERAIGIFEGLLKRPEGTAHSALITAVLGIAEAQMELKTPEVADDVIEQFIDHHPADPDLPHLFARLDELYRAEHKPSRNELERWVRSPEQPRRTFARWYLARFEIRAGRSERARQLFTDLRNTGVKSQATAPALVEFAQFEIDDKRFDEAISILGDARSFHPDPSLLSRIDFLSAQAQYLAKRFDTAAAEFEQIARSGSPWQKVALFNASTGRLQLGDHSRFLTDYSEFEKAGGDKEARADLRLEEGLVQAGKGDQKAERSLQQFVHDFPKNP